MSTSLEAFRTADHSRVLVVGTTCAGKTTYARRLGAQLGAPHVELDALYWLPGWTARPRDDFRARVRDAVAGETWVLDGNYALARDIVWPRATSVIWLNYPLPTVFARGLRRTLRRCWRREELSHGNRETYAKAFLSRESILLWLLSSHFRGRREYRSLFDGDAYENVARIEFRRPRQAERSLEEGLSGRATAGGRSTAK